MLLGLRLCLMVYGVRIELPQFVTRVLDLDPSTGCGLITLPGWVCGHNLVFCAAERSQEKKDLYVYLKGIKQEHTFFKTEKTSTPHL
jgi:hypothetical protein